MTGLDPLALRERIKAAMVLFGEPFAPLPTGTPARVGVFEALPRGAAATYVPDASVAGLVRPILSVHVPYDDTTPVLASFVWRGRTLRVEAAIELKAMGATLARLLIAA